MNFGSSGMLCIDLGGGSELLYASRFFPAAQSQQWMNYLDQYIPWVRPSLHVYGRTFPQPRDTWYVASEGLTAYEYSGYQPLTYSWDDYPPLKEILKAVHEALPECSFNSLLLNRYEDGADSVGWHSDNEPLYGPTPNIASVTFGAEREFLLRRNKTGMTWKGEDHKSFNIAANTKGTSGSESEQVKSHGLASTTRVESSKTPSINRTRGTGLSRSANRFQQLKSKLGDGVSKLSKDKYSFMLKHGSLLVMKGYTQRDWQHSVPKCWKVPGLRINLTFRCVL